MWALVSDLVGQEHADSHRETDAHHAALGEPILQAAENGDIDAIRDLLSRGASLTSEVEGMTPLHRAASTGQIETLAFLIEYGISIDTGTGRESHTPLHIAAGAGHIDVIDWLLAHGADIDGGDTGFSPLAQAVVSNQTDAARRLIESGADVRDEPASTLIEAARAGSTDLVSLLLDHGADVDDRESLFSLFLGAPRPHRPLYYAVRNRHVEVTRLLLDRGADLEAGSSQDDLLHVAIENGDAEMVELLLAHHADPNRSIRTALGSGYRSEGYRRITPLQRAALQDRQDIVALLERHGATG